MFSFLLWLLLGLTTASAQNVTCATRPPGDSSNACASTAFVQQGFLPIPGPFTPNLPLIGSATGGFAQGTRSGTTTLYGTVSGTPINGDCVSWNSGDLIDAGAPCGSGGGGSGTVSAGLAGQLAYYPANGTTVTGLSSATQGETLAFSSTTPMWLSNAVSVQSYGAVCDGVTDDTSAIQAAINATQGASVVPGKLILPPGKTCVVNGSGSVALTITQPLILDCQGASLKFSASAPNTRSMISIAPTTSGTFRRFRITNCFLNNNATGDASIVIDATASTTTEIAEVEIDHVTDSASANSTGYSILLLNTSSNTNGGIFNTNFHDNVLVNGIYSNFAGDSIRIENNILTGAKYGVYIHNIAGGAGFIFRGNNVSAAAPMLIDYAAGTIDVVDNEFEQQVTNTNANNVLVNFRGSSGTMSVVNFTGNSINGATTGLGNPGGVYINNTVYARLDGNYIATTSGATCVINNSSTQTVFGAANYLTGCTTKVTGTVLTNTTHAGFP